MFSRGATLIIIMISTLFLSACSGIEIPPDKKDFIGIWQGIGMRLVITPDGGIDYKRVSGTGSTSVTAPILAFDGNDFIVGVWKFTTRFKVSQPPKLVKGKWMMVVDGVVLTREPVLMPDNVQNNKAGAKNSV